MMCSRTALFLALTALSRATMAPAASEGVTDPLAQTVLLPLAWLNDFHPTDVFETATDGRDSNLATDAHEDSLDGSVEGGMVGKEATPPGNSDNDSEYDRYYDSEASPATDPSGRQDTADDETRTGKSDTIVESSSDGNLGEWNTDELDADADVGSTDAIVQPTIEDADHESDTAEQPNSESNSDQINSADQPNVPENVDDNAGTRDDLMQSDAENMRSDAENMRSDAENMRSDAENMRSDAESNAEQLGVTESPNVEDHRSESNAIELPNADDDDGEANMGEQQNIDADVDSPNRDAAPTAEESNGGNEPSVAFFGLWSRWTGYAAGPMSQLRGVCQVVSRQIMRIDWGTVLGAGLSGSESPQETLGGEEIAP